MPDVPANFVAQAVDDDALNFRTGHTVEVGQNKFINDTAANILDTAGLNFAQYVRDAALATCREQAAIWLDQCGVRSHAPDLVLTNGAHNSVMVALNAILHGREPAIATTELTYPGFRQTAHLCRAKLLGIKSDEDGILPDALEFACRNERIQALLISSNVHNPTCTATSLERRIAIAELARKYDFQIIEDDVYGTLISDKSQGFDTICPERTWHATSLSKCFAAGLRIGFLQCPKGRGSLGLRVMQGMSLSISQLLTSLVERLFLSGKIDEFGEKIAIENKARVNIARTVLADWPMQHRDGVNFIWVRTPEGWTGSAFLSACEAEGILVGVADKFTLPGICAPNAVRLTLSHTQNHEILRNGLEKVDRILRSAPPPILT